jgi:predicted DNA-binding transcriptional regulator AlpA
VKIVAPPLQVYSGPRRGLKREDAAAYIGVSPNKFDELVADGRMPKPRRIDARKSWDIRELDVAYEALPREDEAPATNSWADR